VLFLLREKKPFRTAWTQTGLWPLKSARLRECDAQVMARRAGGTII
jgi:hypothetical protein